MPPQDINWLARKVVRDSDFEHMMWYCYYIKTEDMDSDENQRLKKVIGNIIAGAEYYGLAKNRIYELSLSSFVLIMDAVHLKFANDHDTFIAYSYQLWNCLQTLMENDLIDANPMDQLMGDPDYYGKYGW